MIPGDTQSLNVICENLGSNCLAHTDEDGVTTVFVSPDQPFGAAVERLMKAVPGLGLTRAQHLIRTHCPEIREMNERLGIDTAAVPRFEAAPEAGAIELPEQQGGAHRRPRASRWARIAAVATPAILTGAAAAHFLFPGSGGSGGKAAAGTSVSEQDKDAAETYELPEYKEIVKDGQIMCDPIGQYEAKCVDGSGETMTSEASVGTSTAFTFSYSDEKIGFRIFPNENSAAAWAAEDANSEVYQHLWRHGRVVLWGTDPQRLGEWRKALEQHDQSKVVPQAASAPLPAPLDALAFGTLGVNEETFSEGVSGEDGDSGVQLLRAVMLVLGTADPDSAGEVKAGADDAVAVVVGAPDEPDDGNEAAQAGGHDPQGDVVPIVDPKPSSGVVIPAAGGDTAPVVEPTPTAPEPQPETGTSTSTGSATGTGASTPAEETATSPGIEEPAKETPPPAVETPVAETPEPEQPGDAAVEPPAEQTPPQAEQPSGEALPEQEQPAAQPPAGENAQGNAEHSDDGIGLEAMPPAWGTRKADSLPPTDQQHPEQSQAPARAA